jgi:hypothetical protein
MNDTNAAARTAGARRGTVTRASARRWPAPLIQAASSSELDNRLKAGNSRMTMNSTVCPVAWTQVIPAKLYRSNSGQPHQRERQANSQDQRNAQGGHDAAPVALGGHRRRAAQDQGRLHGRLAGEF